MDNNLDRIRIIEPVFDIVKFCHGQLPMSVGTGRNRETVERMFAMFGLNQYFELSVTATDMKNFKPHPETFLKCAELMGVKMNMRTALFESYLTN